ncbi:hypothetical protein TSUD_81100 [Trifolium subterraneum]|uniref:RNase H type-1 domain-containing protein n=1 Tax=Trifolium subterraneum TaxID=3900 RepID=A0A2Z6NA82_TRISU|nr:hypothetical protein TSUD_81100 [Trifolium subterraneum]
MQPPQEQQVQQWQKPPFGWYKCNVDAGFYNERRKTSAGWCVCDHAGQFIMAGTSWEQGKCSIIEGEAITLLETMKEMTRRGLTYVIFETDSKRVVEATQKPHRANMVAHKLARAAISWASRYYLVMLLMRNTASARFITSYSINECRTTRIVVIKQG